MDVINYALSNNIKIADVIIVKRPVLMAFEHYLVYAGKNKEGQPMFIANQNVGNCCVRYLTEPEIEAYRPLKIRKITGNEIDREEALNKAKQMIGRKYDVINFNCLQFANYVQSIKKYNPLYEISKFFEIGTHLKKGRKL